MAQAIRIAPARMEALRARLDGIIPLLQGRRRAALIDLPVHGNLGDHLIAEGSEALLAQHGIPVVHRMCESDFSPHALRQLPFDVALVFIGGGNMGDVWPFFEDMRQQAVAACPDHRVVLLPQSIQFNDEAALARAAAVYGRHPNLTLCARDRPSRDVARAEMARDVVLMPDMAHALWQHFPWPTASGGRGTMRLLRQDEEGSGGQAGQGLDWADLMPPGVGPLLLAHRPGLRMVQRMSGGAAGGIGYASLARMRRTAIRAAARHFARHAEVETDRLHGTLLAALLGLPFRFDDSGNSYPKLSRYWNCWGQPDGPLPPMR